MRVKNSHALDQLDTIYSKCPYSIWVKNCIYQGCLYGLFVRDVYQSYKLAEKPYSLFLRYKKLELQKRVMRICDEMQMTCNGSIERILMLYGIFTHRVYHFVFSVRCVVQMNKMDDDQRHIFRAHMNRELNKYKYANYSTFKAKKTEV